MAEKTIETLQKELRGATQNRKKIRILVELSDLFYLSDAVVSLDYAKEAWKLSKRLPADADRATALYKYARSLIKTSEFLEARPYISEALTIYRSLGNISQTASSLNVLGNTYLPLAEYAKAIGHYTESLELAKEAGEESLQTMVLGNIGLIYSKVGDHYKSFRYHSEAVELALKIGTGGLGPGYLNLGSVYWSLHEPEKARQYLELAYQEGMKNNDIMCIQMSLMNLAETDAEMQRYESALEQYNKAEVIAREQDFRYQQSNILEKKAKLQSILGNHNEALRIYDEAFAVVQNYNLEIQLPNLLALKAQTYIDLKEYDLAISILNEAILLAQKNKEKETQAAIYQALGVCFQQQKQYEKAFEAQLAYSKLNEELFNLRQQQAMSEAHIRLEIESALREREKIRGEKEHLQFELASKQQELTAVALQIAKQNETLGKLTEQLRTIPTIGGTEEKKKTASVLHQIDRLRTNNSDWKNFEAQFDTTNAGFTSELSKTYPSLSPKELRVCVLMKLNLSTKDIANTLAISQRTVEVHRLRIRKKMKLNQTDNLAARLAAIQ
ncbi:MAG: tetratricopeptide repeat protein [Ignavibacteriota bacterium]